MEKITQFLERLEPDFKKQINLTCLKVYLLKKDIKKQPPDVFCAKFTGSNIAKFNSCAGVSFLIKLQSETLVHVFSCEFCEILRTPFSKNVSRRLLPDTD